MKKIQAINPRWAYIALLPISLLIPLSHFYFIDNIIEQSRYATNLLPSHLLLFRWFGEMSRFAPVILLALFASSWKFKGINKSSSVAKVSTLFYILTVLYAGYLCQLIRLGLVRLWS